MRPLTQDILLRSNKISLKTTRFFIAVLAVTAVLLAIILRDAIDTTSIFASLMMSLGFVVLVIWIFPKLNKWSIQLGLALSFFGVILFIATKGIQATMIGVSFLLSIIGVILGIVLNRFYFRNKH